MSELEGMLKPMAIERAGFKADSKPYEVLMKHYSGDLQDTGAILKFAEDEFGYTPGGDDSGGAPPQAPARDDLTDTQRRADNLRAASQPLSGDAAKTREQELLAEAREAEAAGDLMTAISKKNEAFDLRQAREGTRAG